MHDKRMLHYELTSLGDFYPLNIEFDWEILSEQLKALENSWHVYNKSKPGFKRQGLSLFSLDGSTSGEIDLNSVREYNLYNDTNYNELSFKTPTPHWSHLSSISAPLKNLEPELGRSHLIKLTLGGFFPPHRDLGDSFRLIAFFNCSSDSLTFLLDDRKVFFKPNYLYFANTRKAHSLFSFDNECILLVLNVAPNESTTTFVLNNLADT